MSENGGRLPATSAFRPTPLRAVREAKHALAERRARARFIDPAVLSDPAWEMLVDLFVREADGLRTSVSSLCHASSGSATTALRWQATLVASGMIVRIADDRDQRRSHVRLTTKAREALTDFFMTAARQRDEDAEARLGELESQVASISRSLQSLVDPPMVN